MLEKIVNNDKMISVFKKKYMLHKIYALKSKQESIEKEILKYGMILNYDEYKKKGFTKDQIKKFYEQDKNLIINAKESSKKYEEKKQTMFGYPSNMIENDFIEEYLKNIDLHLPLLNNCGEMYNDKENKCNYAMDSKEYEFKIIKLFCENFNLSIKKYVGYVTTGGTEGNFYGIRQGIEKFPNGIVYYSKAAHYSIDKYLNLSNGKKIFESIIIQTNNDGTIDCDVLLNIIEKNWNLRKKPAILILTWGTTVYGSVDNVEYIINELKKKQIPYYVHLDAAFYGGIPKNQKKAPSIKKISKLNIDSLSVSLHKYIGCSLVGGIVLRRKIKQKNNYISYIEQEDSTFLGSRSILPFSTLYHVNKILNRSNCMEYSDNVCYFEYKLKENNILYTKYKNGNTFILYNIENTIAKKYQLAALETKNTYHVIIMPFHTKKALDNLINDLVVMYAAVE